jgi:SLT domain-containing protein
MIQKESSGNPRAINNWDSNAKKGTPSKGLMQTIDPTFKQWALPGYNSDVYDPVSNIIAGVRYAQNRYGDGMLKTGGRKKANGSYKGY